MTVTDVAGVNDNEVASGGCHRPTTATTVADATNVDDDEATNGGRCLSMADVNNDKAMSGGRRRPTDAALACRRTSGGHTSRGRRPVQQGHQR
jgi:hypothetical protein